MEKHYNFKHLSVRTDSDNNEITVFCDTNTDMDKLSLLIGNADQMLIELKNAVINVEKLLSISHLESNIIKIYKREIELHKQLIEKVTGEQ